jgi:transitional endoplasmic reticulum ATPase
MEGPGMSEHCPHETQVNDPFHHTCKDCRDQTCGHHQVALHVVKALIEDGEAFKARISPANMKYLHIQEGDFLLLKGTRSAVVPVGPSAPIIGSEAIIHLDPLTLSNAGTFLFSKVIVQKAIPLPARKIVLMPEKPQLIKEERQAILKERMQGVVVLTGNRIPVSLDGDKKGVFWIQATQPEGPVQVESQTTLVFQEETGEGGRDNAISYEQIGGLEKEIARIREIVELPLWGKAKSE